jgi:hypothetical protein
MSRTIPLRKREQVTADASGGGQVEIRNNVYGATWNVRLIGLEGQPRPFTNEPECRVYRDGMFIGGSGSGSMDSDSAINETVNNGEGIQAVWTGGDPGATYILTLSGDQTITGG